jgi:dipeptide/tripeptide permease
MNTIKSGFPKGRRLLIALAAIAVTIGAILLSIVEEPRASESGFIIGIGAVICGLLLFVVCLEQLVSPTLPTKFSWRDIARGLAYSMLLLIGAGLVIQAVVDNQFAYNLLVARAPVLLLVMLAIYVAARRVVGSESP